MNDKNHNGSDGFKEQLLKRLETEGISPHSKLYWLTHEYALWGAWGATVLLGALAVAVTSFASLHIGYALYEATHNDFLTFIFDALPYMWLMAFAVLLGVAYFNLRHTKRGYRYPMPLVIISTFGFSLVGGGMLHLLGGGWYMDKWLGEALPAYQSRAEFEEALWQAPVAGRLVGRAMIKEVTSPVNTVAFVDAREHEWKINTGALREREGELLLSGNKVRILMATSSRDGDDVLYACAVFPWLLDHAPPIKEWRQERGDFIENIKFSRERAKVSKNNIPPEIRDLPASSTMVIAVGPNSPCDNLPVFKYYRP